MLGWVIEIVNEQLEEISSEYRVEPEVKEERLSICEGCERFQKLSRRCKECGCFMDVKCALKRLPFSEEAIKCPLNKWH